MRLKSAHLREVCQHRDLFLEFPLGVTGVFGPNGSGKSNLFKMIKASLTGDFSVNPGSKDENIRRGAPSTATSKVVSNWNQDGTDFELTRSLRPNKNSLSVKGQPKVITKVGDITATLEGMLELPKRIINEFVFVDQWSIFAFLSTQPADRAKLFSHLCDTDHAEDIWKAIGDQQNKDNELATNFIDNSDEIRRHRRERIVKIKELKSKLAKERLKILTKSQGKLLKETIKKRDRFDLLCERRDGKEVDLHNVDARIAEASKVQKRLEAGLGKMEADTEALRNMAEESRQAIKKYEEMRKAWTRAERLTRILSRHGPAEPDEPEDYTDPAILQDRCEQLQEETIKLASVIDLMESGEEAECPLCGGSITAREEQLKSFRKEVAIKTQEYDQMHSRIDSCLLHASGHSEWQSDYTRFEAKQEAAREELEQMGDVGEPEDLDEDELQGKVNKYDEKREELTELKSAIAATAIANAKLEGSKHTIEEELESMEEEGVELDLMMITKKDASSARKKLNSHREGRVAAEGLRRTIEEWQAFVEEDDDALEQLEVMRERTANAREWIEDLERWRSVVHRDALPRIVAQHMLEDLEEKINETLEEFGGPFRVTADEDLTFVAHKPNGVSEPASRLSGGEKVVLALAFRFAVNSLFAGEIGMMVLDEPTAGLDEHNIGCLTDVLGRLSELTKKRGQQLIIITHDQRLERVFDNIIRLERIS